MYSHRPFSQWTPEQKEKHYARTARWRSLNREKHLRSQAAAARRRNQENPKPRTPEIRAKHAEYSRRARAKNPQLQRDASRRWRLKNLAHVKIKSKSSQLKRAYGITLDQYNAMLTAQSFACAICEVPFGMGPKDTHVDHCHGTGRVRAILCHGCNNMLGRARDQADLLRRGAEYLERWTTT